MPGFPPFSEESLQFYLWGLRKGFLMPEIQVPEIDVPEEQLGPFNMGIRDGENFGANGIPVDQVCYDLKEHPTPLAEVLEVVDGLLEAGGLAASIVKHGLAASALEAGLLVFMVSIAATTHFMLPTEAIKTSQVRRWADFLNEIEEPLSIELFFGGGIDADIDGCQLKATRIYKKADFARQEISRMGRPASILMSIRTDMSGGLRVVEETGEIPD